ncbi:MAG: DNA polymerase III subunit delta' [Sphingomonadales bacterium]|nr:DNA polymerase III subunit delta' [Sphingomonadales bacterium]MDE2570095.1 DNA polymerase III subunit delta' [Sphingomonadales bacterium]
MTSLLGHDEAWRTWRAAEGGTRMHHAWILAGREGLGKASFALRAAAEYVAEPGVSQPHAEAHPDISVLEPLPATEEDARKQAEGKPFARKRSISVDQVRQMQRRLVTRPTLGPRRALVIDAADDLEKSAVNALLKSLEEPPAGTVFLLVAHRLGRLLPTVRSRCRILRFHPLGPGELARAVDSARPGLQPRTREAALAFAGGSPGAAIAFAEQDLGKVHDLFARLLEGGDPDFSGRADLSAALGQRPSRERQLAAIEAARMVLVEHLREADEAQRLRIADAHAGLVRLATQATTYNFDPALLMLEIGGLLAGVGRSRESAR